MKKYVTILLAGVMACTVSCALDPLERVDQDVEPGFVFTANLGPEAKVILGEDGETPYWESGDYITIFPEGESAKGVVFTASLQKGQKALTADFTCPRESIPDFESFEKSKSFIAVYGNLTAGAIRNGNIITGIEIPAEQKAVAGTYDRMAVPMVARTGADHQLYFQNLSSLLAFKVGTRGINKVTFTFDGIVSGLFDLDEKDLLTPEEGKGGTSVALTMEAVNEFEKDRTYYLSLLPGKYSVTAAFNGAIVKSSGQNRIGYSKNIISNMGTLQLNKFMLIGTPVRKIGGIELNDGNEELREFKLTKDGKYFVLENVTLEKSDIDGWSDQFWIQFGEDTKMRSKFSLNKWIDLNRFTNGANMKYNEPSSGVYDFYLRKDGSQLYVSRDGQSPDRTLLGNTSVHIGLRRSDFSGLQQLKGKLHIYNGYTKEPLLYKEGLEILPNIGSTDYPYYVSFNISKSRIGEPIVVSLNEFSKEELGGKQLTYYILENEMCFILEPGSVFFVKKKCPEGLQFPEQLSEISNIGSDDE